MDLKGFMEKFKYNDYELDALKAEKEARYQEMNFLKQQAEYAKAQAMAEAQRQAGLAPSASPYQTIFGGSRSGKSTAFDHDQLEQIKELIKHKAMDFDQKQQQPQDPVRAAIDQAVKELSHS